MMGDEEGGEGAYQAYLQVCVYIDRHRFLHRRIWQEVTAPPPQMCPIIFWKLLHIHDHKNKQKRSQKDQADRMQCQMLLYKKLTCKGTLRQVFYLSEAPSPPMTLYPPPPYTLYRCIQYLFTQGRGRGAYQRTCQRGNSPQSRPKVYTFYSTPVMTTFRVWCLYSYLVHGRDVYRDLTCRWLQLKEETLYRHSSNLG